MELVGLVSTMKIKTTGFVEIEILQPPTRDAKAQLLLHLFQFLAQELLLIRG